MDAAWPEGPVDVLQDNVPVEEDSHVPVRHGCVVIEDEVSRTAFGRRDSPTEYLGAGFEVSSPRVTPGSD